MNEQLQMMLLGPPDVTRNGRPLHFAHRKSLALLCYLALSSRNHSRGALAGLLWSDATETNARAGLRKSLAELRRLTPKNLFITRHEIAFNHESSYRLDVDSFVAAAQRLQLAQGSALADPLVAVLVTAADLYRGDFMAGFQVLRAQPFEEWILLEREHLRLSALQLHHALAIHYFTRACYTEAAHYARRVIDLEACHEEAHRLLMSLYALQGQRAAALRQFDLCRMALEMELGLKPDPQTQALYERIRDRIPAAGSQPPLPAQIERPTLPLIGRRRERDDIIDRLRNPGCRLLTLIGPGGCGKTHLVREIAARMLAQEAQQGSPAWSIYFISLGSSPTVESLIPAIAQGVGFYFSQESRPRRQLLTYLRRQKALLILDACEGLLDLYEKDQGSFVDLVQDILAVAPGITILATSRSRLNLSAEQLYPLAGLDYPETLSSSVQQLQAHDAVQLFSRRVLRFQPDFSPTRQDVLAIAGICRYARGMPLEILLMANWARLLDPPAILAQLQFNDSGAASPTPLQRDLQRSLTPVFDQSWHLLNAHQQQQLILMSVFRESFTFEQIHSISGISHSDLMNLLDLSMVNQTGLPLLQGSSTGLRRRYELHDLFAEYVCAKSDLAPLIHQAREEHASYFIRDLHRWSSALLGGREQEALRSLDIEIANVRAAWHWSVSHGRFDLLAQGADCLCRYYLRRFRYSEGETDCRTAVRAVRSTADDAPRLLAKLLAWQSYFTADHMEALILLDQGMALLARLDPGQDGRAEKAWLLYVRGHRLLNDNHEQAWQILAEALDLFLELGDDWHAAQTYHLLHIQTWKAGDLAQGASTAEKGLALFQKVGYLKGYAGLLGDSGLRLLLSGQHEAGMAAIVESKEIFEQLGDRAGTVKSLYFSSMAAAFSGDWPAAVAQLRSCIDIGEDYSNFYDTLLIALSLALAHCGQYAEAEHHAQMGLQLAIELENQMCIGRAYSALALAALGAGQAPEARRFAELAIAAYERSGQKTELGTALAACGYATLLDGDPDQANAYFNQALQAARSCDDQFSLLYASLGSILLLAHTGQIAEARRRYQNVAHMPTVANSRWFTDLVKFPVERAA